MKQDVWQRVIDPSHVFIIAEAGVNHNGDVSMAMKMIDVAKEAGVDAIKFQTFKAERMISKKARKSEYQKKGEHDNESQLELVQRYELSEADHMKLVARCQEVDLCFLSTPFDFESADLLDELGIPLFKIGSGDLNNHPFLEHVAQKGRPMLLSTGMSFLSEVDEAIRVVRSAGAEHVALMHCVSSYPAPFEDVNLRVISSMQRCFGIPVGYSDHTLGIEIPIAAVAAGACIIEKHFTLDKDLPGPDHRASLEADDLKRMVVSIRNVEKALGDGIKEPKPAERDVRKKARKSLVAIQKIAKNTVITRDMVAIKRPGDGLEPRLLNWVIGRVCRRDLEADEIITDDDV